MRLSREFMLGGFTLLALTLLAGVTIYLNQWDVLHRNAIYYVRFKEVKQLEEGAPVNVSGIKVGKVARMTFESGFGVRVKIQVNKTVHLFSNASVMVHAAEVLGDTTLEIDPGHAGPGITIIPPEAMIEGVGSSDLTHIVTEVSADIRSTLQGASAILNDPHNQASIKQIMGNLASATGRLDQALNMFNTEFPPVMEELRSTSKNFNEFIVQGKGASAKFSDELAAARASISSSADEIGRGAKSISTDFNSTTQHLQRTLDSLDGTVKQSDKQLHDALDQLNAASRTLNDLLTRTRNGEGTIGRLLTDARPFEELRQLISTLGQAITGGKTRTFPIGDTVSPMPKPTPPAREPVPQAPAQ